MLIVGIALAVLIVIGLAAWLVVHALSKRNTAQREDARGATFLNVRGLVNESNQKRSVSRSVLRLRLCSHAPSYGLAMKGDLFSRNQMSENVVLPEKTVIAGGSSDVKQEILQLYAAEVVMCGPGRARKPGLGPGFQGLGPAHPRSPALGPQ